MAIAAAHRKRRAKDVKQIIDKAKAKQAQRRQQTFAADTARDPVQELMKQIRELKREEIGHRPDRLRNLVDQGRALSALKDAVRHGDWSRCLKELSINESTAQRLVKLADSELGKQIRTAGRDFCERLPVDVQKLAALLELNAEQLNKVVQEHDLNDLDRTGVRKAVGAVLGKTKTRQPANAVSRLRKLCRSLAGLKEEFANVLAEHGEDSSRQGLMDELNAAMEALQVYKSAVEAAA